MTDKDIQRKIENIKSSDAPVYLKEQAIKELENKLSTNSIIATALKQMKDSAPDYSDIGD